MVVKATPQKGKFGLVKVFLVLAIAAFVISQVLPEGTLASITMQSSGIEAYEDRFAYPIVGELIEIPKELNPKAPVPSHVRNHPRLRGQWDLLRLKIASWIAVANKCVTYNGRCQKPDFCGKDHAGFFLIAYKGVTLMEKVNGRLEKVVYDVAVIVNPFNYDQSTSLFWKQSEGGFQGYRDFTQSSDCGPNVLHAPGLA